MPQEKLLQSICPPEKTVLLTSGFASGTYPSTGTAAGRIFKAAELSPSGTDDQLLCVHPVGNEAGVTYLMPLKAGGRNSCRFDYVVFTGSTVTMANVTLFEEEK